MLGKHTKNRIHRSTCGDIKGCNVGISKQKMAMTFCAAAEVEMTKHSAELGPFCRWCC